MKSESPTKNVIFYCIKKNKFRIFVIVLLALIASSVSLVNPILFKITIDTIIPSKDISLLLLFLLLMTTTPCFSVLLTSVKSYFAAALGEIFTRELRTRCFNKSLYSKYENLEKISPAQILHRITRECGRLELYIINDVTSFLSEAILLSTILTTMFFFNVKLTLICLIAFPISTYLTSIVSKTSRKIDFKLMDVLEKGNQLLIETLNMIKFIKIKNGYEYENNKWREWLNNYKSAKLKAAVTNNLNRFLMGDLIINTIYGILFFYASLQVMNNAMTLGELVTFVAFVPRVYSSLRKILNIKMSTSIINNAIEQIDEILNLPQEKTGGIILEEHINIIEYKNVEFSYNRKDFNIKNISFKINKGKKLGIIGMSGGGKSTLLELLTKLYMPKKGGVYINNIDLNDINIENLRSKMSIVTQDVNLFNDNIKNNITYPFNNYSEKDLSKIINVVGLKDFIDRLPEGLDTIVGNNGRLISGGEKQRIGIANALFKDTEIILLDEFTSALDVSLEREIINYILSLKDKIVIMVTHRIYSIMGFDEIIVIENGEIIESGIPKVLFKDVNSRFYEISKNMEYK